MVKYVTRATGQNMSLPYESTVAIILVNTYCTVPFFGSVVFATSARLLPGQDPSYGRPC